VQYLKTRWKRISKVGLLATTGTIQTGLFQKALSHTGIEVVLPDPKVQENWVMEAIYGKQGIKVIGPSENSKRLILKASEKLVRLGAQAIIAGCTEVPLVLKDGDLSVPVVDPISVLAKTAIEKAQGRKKSE
jgi:aspartate racemase